MDRVIRVLNKSREDALVCKARWCESFFCRLRGLTFRREIPENEGLLLVESSEGRVNTSIHMLFVFFSIGVFWLNAEGEVVDKTIAHPWRFYRPQRAAQYVLETPPEVFTEVQIGDTLAFIDEK